MIPRHGDGHFSIPFEIGFQYISTPTITLDLQGTACSGGICQNTQTNPQSRANLQQETKTSTVTSAVCAPIHRPSAWATGF